MSADEVYAELEAFVVPEPIPSGSNFCPIATGEANRAYFVLFAEFLSSMVSAFLSMYSEGILFVIVHDEVFMALLLTSFTDSSMSSISHSESSSRG